MRNLEKLASNSRYFAQTIGGMIGTGCSGSMSRLCFQKIGCGHMDTERTGYI